MLKMGRRPPNEPEIYNEFIQEVLMAGKNGVSQSILARKIQCDRTSIYRAGLKAMKRGIVRIQTKGKRTSYLSTDKIITDHALAAFLLGRYAFRKIVKNPALKTIKLKMLASSGERAELELVLLTFIIRVGIVVTYLLLEAMGRGNRILAETYSGKEHALSDDLKDALILEWIKNSITPIIPLLSHEFKNILYKSTGTYPIDFEERIRFSQKRPKFAIERDIAQNAFSAFEKLFPSEIGALWRISEGLPDAIEFEKQYIERAETANSKGDTSHLKN
jgi:hypothetical protein